MSNSPPPNGTNFSARVQRLNAEAAPEVNRRSRSAKATFIIDALDELIGNVPIPLYHQDPFTLLVAVILSGQCTDAKVNEVSPRLFSQASTPATMGSLPVSTIEDIIRPCGLASNKARNIRKTSRILLDCYGSQVPSTQQELETLPGVGPKTAQVVLAQAFGADTFPVDTHIHRLAYRWGLSPGLNVTRTERDLKRLFPKRLWSRLHLQIIIFGRTYCPARGHLPANCPICRIVGRRKLADC